MVSALPVVGDSRRACHDLLESPGAVGAPGLSMSRSSPSRSAFAQDLRNFHELARSEPVGSGDFQELARLDRVAPGNFREVAVI